MLSLELSINIVALLALMTVSGLAGFALRRWHIVKIRARLYRVENEVIRSHKEILELQKECLSVEQQLRGIRNPVIMMSSPSQNKSDKKLPNAAHRKKLLTNVLTMAHIFN
ncbi:MAG TPA: hypothetical protein VFC34_14135 [Puia sp.]|nr:hypothetical protein [Puia sp.]